MQLLGTLKCLNPEDVLQDIGFTPLVAEKLQVLGPPELDELRLLREGIDPSGIIIRGEKMRLER